ncbi:MAG TPA: prolyl oligopeptidase family serine peptidase [Panacibacter sp.]|nr:prolyl oligopeptidase family serine peptidase [Panacibacter sp.]HNP45361.1 prolyl oligopeptidase family serine peptidase [Panacibacter sp.]
MQTKYLLSAALIFSAYLPVIAQHKPLDHTVYDAWQSIGEKRISSNGAFVLYSINVQQGDAMLVIQKTNGEHIADIPRGYEARISSDDRYVVCKIKPTYNETRAAKIAKKKADELPKDSLCLIDISNGSIRKWARVKSYQLPDKTTGLLAWQYEKAAAKDSSSKKSTDSTKKKDDDVFFTDADGAGSDDDKPAEGSMLVLYHLQTATTDSFPDISEYLADRNGNNVLMESAGNKKDSVKPSVIVWHAGTAKKDTILYQYNDAKAYAWDSSGNQLAFIAERDSSTKALQKFYKLYYYRPGFDSAAAIADRSSKGVKQGYAVGENPAIHFSKSAKRLLFGVSAILPPKDTTVPEFERSSVDVWNYKDEDLMTVQLKNLDKDAKRNYTAIYDIGSKTLLQPGDKDFRTVLETAEGDGDVFYATTDTGRRVARQWQGYTFSDVYAVDTRNGNRSLVVKNFRGNLYESYSGKYLLLYDNTKRSYSIYNSINQKLYRVGADIPYPLFDEENDVPGDPSAYGIAKWIEADAAVLIYDRYDVWKVDAEGKTASVKLTDGRTAKQEYRYISLDEDEHFIKPGQPIAFRVFDETSKGSSFVISSANATAAKADILPANVNVYLKARKADVYAYSKETFSASPDMYIHTGKGLTKDQVDQRLSSINPQQKDYAWGTAALFKWKAYTGKLTEGILYKPEDYDANKRYPMIVYFYERNNETLHNYLPPAPTPSRLNIPFFVSRGYVVFVPDIWYTTGKPGQSAYDYIVSGTRALISKGIADSTRIGLQGQSWGGYQTAFIITQTKLYKAAWAGAPVANMFSAYGGIRWESGLNRQMQYEKEQSRIGATIWQRPDLYIANSPLFHLPKVTTPLVIMSNDADGAVPWYQGIELFTAMRRLNKPVWLLDYNNEAHNLVERRNRKDIQIREQQFFDWLLKDAAPPTWITEGVPAVMKGRTWGLE